MEVSGGLTASAAVDRPAQACSYSTPGSTLEIAQALGADSRISFTTGSELVVDHAALFVRTSVPATTPGRTCKISAAARRSTSRILASPAEHELHEGDRPVAVEQLRSQVATLDFQNSSVGAGTFHFSATG